MFSRFARLPLRRCLHTAPSPKKAPFNIGKTTRTILAASALATAFIGYQISREANEIALDAHPVSRSPAEKPLAHSLPKPSRPTDSSSEPPLPAASTSSSESDASVPDEPSDAPSDSAVSTPESGTTEATPEVEGTSEEGTSEEGKPAASGAFNPETGEINWDCPCLGGMAHGPCGPEFREAFSCFVFSEAEPKGINCVDKFQNMQNCFRAHPEVYADEIMDDEDEAPAATDDSNALPEPANGDKLDGVAPSEVDTTQKPHIEGSHIASESS